MGWLAIVAYIVAVVWAWVNFGVLTGVLFGLAGFFVLNLVGSKIDERFRPRSKTFLEFHEAWDLFFGPPTDTDALSAKRHHLSVWRGESRRKREPASVWLERKFGEPAVADWPQRTPSGHPQLRVDVSFFDEQADEWRDGTLLAEYLRGPQEISVHIYDGQVNCYWTRNNTWLVKRPDLDYHLPAHELRGFSSGDQDQPPSVLRILFIAKESGLPMLASLLESRGLDEESWLKFEPPGFNRLAPSDPFG